ncbi:hypothetical protein JRO89_XS14G0178600 [Xanthoceras sorbifolium]|uniref:Lactate/malate dehydrogenase N-terminal domain-containing protein n=1 Tax=Xanthoceras sorbifolium TaxID=99658 RepID=A0ABQ8H5N0_9ROSI|nr:hypothetical protein JRO89_XS14G0178600 [Xanthoceras sorbifolium]
MAGGFPRKEGMERKDVMSKNVSIYKAQASALEKHAAANCKVLVNLGITIGKNTRSYPLVWCGGWVLEVTGLWCLGFGVSDGEATGGAAVVFFCSWLGGGGRYSEHGCREWSLPIRCSPIGDPSLDLHENSEIVDIQL